MQKFRKIIYNILQNNNLYILKTLNYSLERKTVCSALGLLRYLATSCPHILLRLGNESLTAFMTGPYRSFHETCGLLSAAVWTCQMLPHLHCSRLLCIFAS